MSEPSPPRTITSAAELLEFGVELEGVQFFRLQAEIVEDVAPAAEPPEEIAPVYGLKIRHEGTELGIRVSVTLDLATAKIVVDGAVNYTTALEVQMDEEAALDFANNVGVMAILPYLRQAIADLSQRVTGEIVLMPVIPRGGLVFSRDDAE